MKKGAFNIYGIKKARNWLTAMRDGWLYNFIELPWVLIRLTFMELGKLLLELFLIISFILLRLFVIPGAALFGKVERQTVREYREELIKRKYEFKKPTEEEIERAAAELKAFMEANMDFIEDENEQAKKSKGDV